MIKLLLLALISTLFVSCSSTKHLTGHVSIENENGITDINVLWVKNKNSKMKYDALMVLKNLTEKPIIIYKNHISCYKNDVKGKLKILYKDNQIFDLTPLGEKKIVAVCFYEQDIAEGTYKITIDKVYSNPEGDGVTKGEVIATNIVWKFNPQVNEEETSLEDDSPKLKEEETSLEDDSPKLKEEETSSEGDSAKPKEKKASSEDDSAKPKED